jgi:hypothetical protein
MQMRETSTSEGGNYSPPNFAIRAAIPDKMMGSFTCRKAGTWDIFYFPSEGRHTEDFFDPTASAGFKPAKSGSSDQYANH